MKFVFIDEDDIIKKDSDLNPLEELGEVEVYSHPPETEKELLNRAENADVIFFALTKFSNEILDKLPKLQIMQFLGTGMWNLVDVNYARKKGIKVLNIEGYGNNAVAEYAISAAFSLARNIPEKYKEMENEMWKLGEEGREIKGSRFGVVGTGNIGSEVAKKASLLGADVVAYDIVESDKLKEEFGVKYVSLEKLFCTSDFISLHVKAMKETYNLVNGKLINQMKKTAFFINAARADLVENDVLYEALKNEEIGGAALDVFSDEPLQDYSIAKLDNVIATPHIGFYTEQAIRNMLNMSLDSVLDEFKK